VCYNSNMATLEELEKEVQEIEKRNQRVEADKAWEISSSRKIIISIFTYFFVGLFLSSVGIQRPWISALIPVIGFVLSTLTLPYFKNLWTEHFLEGKNKELN